MAKVFTGELEVKKILVGFVEVVGRGVDVDFVAIF